MNDFVDMNASSSRISSCNSSSNFVLLSGKGCHVNVGRVVMSMAYLVVVASWVETL